LPWKCTRNIKPSDISNVTENQMLVGAYQGWIFTNTADMCILYSAGLLSIKLILLIYL
jgi:hypothetical protein